MSLSPKSNSAILAIDKALNDLNQDIGDMPSYLKSPYKDYKYPHNYKNSYIKQQYLPNNIKNNKYYFPKESSSYEKSLKSVKEKLDKLKE